MQRAYLVSVQLGQKDWETQDSIAELAELAVDAGFDVAGTVVQKRTSSEAATLIGSGKAAELAEMVLPDDVVIFDAELTPAQQGNLSDIIDAPVIDRTQLILD